MGRPRAAKPEVAEDEEVDLEGSDIDESDEEDDDAEDGPAQPGVKKLSKAKAARAAIDRGIESPRKASAFILEEFGVVMAPQHFSAVKSQMRRKEREAAAAGGPIEPGRRGRKPGIDSYLAPPPRMHGSPIEADLLDAMEAIKPLIASLGATKVKRIVELLG